MFRLPIVKFFNRIFNRVTITVVLVALQVLWLLWAFWSFTAGRVWLNGALKALSIMIVLYLVRKDENSAYKIGWIVLIGLLPLLGGALYLAFGNKAPAKYLRERMQKVEQAHQTELAQPEGQTDALDISSRNLSRYVAKFGPYPAWRDTAAHYFSCGEEMYPPAAGGSGQGREVHLSGILYPPFRQNVGRRGADPPPQGRPGRGCAADLR